AIHLNKTLTRSRTVAMDGPRHELFADAALAEEHDRRVGWRCPANGFEHLPERRALTDDFVFRFHRQLQLAVLLPELELIERVLNRDDDSFAAERLVEKIGCARADRLHRSCRRPMTGNHYNWQGVVDRSNLPEHLHTVHTRHLDVEKHE